MTHPHSTDCETCTGYLGSARNAIVYQNQEGCLPHAAEKLKITRNCGAFCYVGERTESCRLMLILSWQSTYCATRMTVVKYIYTVSTTSKPNGIFLL